MSIIFCLRRTLVVGALCLGFASRGQAQVASPPAPPAARQTTSRGLYFLDGQPSDRKTIDQLNPRTIASAQVIRGEDATRVYGAPAGEAVTIIITKRNVGSAAVAEFNRRYNIRPVEAPAPPTPPARP